MVFEPGTPGLGIQYPHFKKLPYLKIPQYLTMVEDAFELQVREEVHSIVDVDKGLSWISFLSLYLQFASKSYFDEIVFLL